MTSLPSSVLVVGVNTRPIVKSAKALGLRTIAVDYFGDVDLVPYADVLFSVKPLKPEDPFGEFGQSSLFELSLRALESYEVDAIILTSGMEHNPEHVKKLGGLAKIIGNKTTQMEFCKDKKRLFQMADGLGIPYPKTKLVRKPDEAIKAANDIGYPVVLKPAFGGGGINVRLVRSQGDLEIFFSQILSAGDNRTLYVQQLVRGIDASASVLSNGKEARCLTINRQIIGDKRLGVSGPFGYCGNIIPLTVKRELSNKITEYSKSLCTEIGMIGSIGVDFVLSDKPYLIEVNPRFQNTIDCVEGLLSINLLREHIRACGGELCKYGRSKGFSAKLILYAKEDVKTPDLGRLSQIVDIPRKGSTVKKGRPICSMLNFGMDRGSLIVDAYKTADRVYDIFR